MSKNTRDIIVAFTILVLIVVAIVTVQYSNAMNVPLELGYDSLKMGLLVFAGSYLVLDGLNRSKKLPKAIIIAFICGSKPVMDFHWTAFQEYPNIATTCLILLVTYIGLFWGDS